VSGRFPLYTDADVQGQCIKALQQAGWDVLRAIDAFPEKTEDLSHFRPQSMCDPADSEGLGARRRQGIPGR
jgi:hypothetical protein